MSAARRWRGEGSSHPLVLPGDLAKLVARRGKTQLRRATQRVRLDDGRLVLRASGMKVGSTYEVRREDRPDEDPVARIVVSGIAAQQLGDVTPADAIAEGHKSLAGFADWWMRRRLVSWPPQEEKLCPNCHGHAEYVDHEGETVACTTCEFGVVMVDQAVEDELVLERFAQRFATRWVWVVSFALDERLYLHRVSEYGYTSDPREALEPVEVLGNPSPNWRSTAAQRRREDLADTDAARLSGLPTIDDQLEELRRMAAERGVDLTRERHVLAKSLQAIGRKLAGP